MSGLIDVCGIGWARCRQTRPQLTTHSTRPLREPVPAGSGGPGPPRRRVGYMVLCITRFSPAIGVCWVRFASHGPKPKLGCISGLVDRIAFPRARANPHVWWFSPLTVAQTHRKTWFLPAGCPFSCVLGCFVQCVPTEKGSKMGQECFFSRVTPDHLGCL